MASKRQRHDQDTDDDGDDNPEPKRARKRPVKSEASSVDDGDVTLSQSTLPDFHSNPTMGVSKTLAHFCQFLSKYHYKLEQIEL